MNFLQDLPIEPPNPVLGLNAECTADPAADKINLTIGAYRDDSGKPYVLPSVRTAKECIASNAAYQNHEYLPQDGLPEFVSATRVFLLGKSSPVLAQKRIYSLQTVAGTAALRVGAEFLVRAKTHFNAHNNSVGEKVRVAIPLQTWQNHPVIMRDAGLEIVTYRYLHESGVAIDFPAMLEDLQSFPAGTIVLLHACAHNPTGCDPSFAQWEEILRVVKERSLFPFFDNAYQGFTTGDSERDAEAVRLFAERDGGVNMLVACSFSKNFGLYGERVGALHVIFAQSLGEKEIETERERCMAMIRAVSRTIYSTCPCQGARIVATILNDAELTAQWQSDCRGMADRLNRMRELLKQKLEEKRVLGNWAHVTAQRGMFSFSGIKGDAVERLKRDYHIYFLKDGRISIAGLNENNIDRFAQACAEVIGTRED